MGVAYIYRCLICYHLGEKHGRVQEDMMLEDQKILHLDPQDETMCHAGHSLSIKDLTAHPPPHPRVAHFLQKSHTHYNKVTPPNNATLYQTII